MRVGLLLVALIGGAFTTFFFSVALANNVTSGWDSLMTLMLVVVLCGVIGIAVPLIRPLKRVAGMVVLGVGLIAIVAIKLINITPVGGGGDVFIEVPNWLLIGPVLLVISGALGIWAAWRPSKRRNRKALDDQEQPT